MATEHEAALRLVRDSEVTHHAARDGAWSDPRTWAEGRVPGKDAVVLIGEGRQVEYDLKSDASVAKVRVDGELAFATDESTLLKVDTILVTETGRLEIGTAADPIDGGVTARIVFADNGAVGHTSWDPTQLHRGLVAQGAVEMHGAEKTASLKVAADPTAGQTAITLEAAPLHWKAGDQIVLTGTHFVAPTVTRDPATGLRTYEHNATQDEVLTIRSIAGRTVTFEEPLRFDHSTPDAGLKASVANLTRSIVLESESAETHHRGHVMLMHTDDVRIANVGFLNLGRTDKSIALDDRVIVPDPMEPGERTAAPAPLDDVTNMRGRYPVHVHRGGTAADGEPAVVEGSVVWGSPGWGFVSHDSHADFTDNVALDAFGSAFVAEVGNETGTWSRNIAIGSDGRDPPPEAVPEFDRLAHDLGHEGNGFWFNGRLIVAQDNVAAGMWGQGFAWLSRGEGKLDIDPDDLLHPESAVYDDRLRAWFPAIHDFTGNEVMASHGGLSINRNSNQQGHDERSHIEDFTAWEVEEGVSLSYTTNYLFERLLLIGAEHPTKPLYQGSRGVHIGKNTESVTVRDADIRNFDQGVYVSRIFDDPFIQNTDPATREDHQYFFIDVAFQDVGTRYGGRLVPAWDKVLDSGDVGSGRMSLKLEDASLHAGWGPRPEDRMVELHGTKTDSLGTVVFPAANERIVIDGLAIAAALRQVGYSVLLDGTRVVVIEVLFSDRATAAVALQPVMLVLDPAWPIYVDMPFLGSYVARPGVQVPRSLIEAHALPVVLGDDGELSALQGTMAADLLVTPESAGGHGAGSVPILRGLAGDDVLQGRGRADILEGGNGDDTLAGGAAADRLEGGNGSDALRGGTEADVLHGGSHDDLLLGEHGDDRLDGGTGDDRLDGGDGNDRLDGGHAHDILLGGDGDDDLRGGDGMGADSLDGGDGDDRLAGGYGTDELAGGNGNDTLAGEAQNDRLAGANGDDRLDGGNGDDRLDGGSGIDRLQGDDGDDVLLGWADADELIGGEGLGVDTLDGGTGDDRLAGGGGDDELVGGSGDDTLGGDDGADRLDGGIASDQLLGGAGDDRLSGGEGHDRLDGGAGDDVVRGEAGNDRLIGGAGLDQLFGGTEFDIFVITAAGAVNHDRIMDYRAGEQLDLSQLLIGFGAGDDLDDFVVKQKVGTDYHFRVDRDGDGAAYGLEIAAVVVDFEGNNLDKTVEMLLANGILIA